MPARQLRSRNQVPAVDYFYSAAKHRSRGALWPIFAPALVVITTSGSRCRLQIGVWDNGPGIPPTIQSSVFQPFVSYGKADGSGLGLAIAKKIVEDHGGEIYLDGKNGTGTLFQITIPFAYSPASNPAHVHRSSPLDQHLKRNGRVVWTGASK